MIACFKVRFTLNALYGAVLYLETTRMLTFAVDRPNKKRFWILGASAVVLPLLNG